MRASIYNAMPEEGVRALVAFMKEFERTRDERSAEGQGPRAEGIRPAPAWPWVLGPRPFEREPMYKIQTLNNIAVAGLDRLPRDHYEVASEIATRTPSWCAPPTCTTW